jgi:hypothetical protein
MVADCMEQPRQHRTGCTPGDVVEALVRSPPTRGNRIIRAGGCHRHRLEDAVVGSVVGLGPLPSDDRPASARRNPVNVCGARTGQVCEHEPHGNDRREHDKPHCTMNTRCDCLQAAVQLGKPVVRVRLFTSVSPERAQEHSRWPRPHRRPRRCSATRGGRRIANPTAPALRGVGSGAAEMGGRPDGRRPDRRSVQGIRNVVGVAAGPGSPVRVALPRLAA